WQMVCQRAWQMATVAGATDGPARSAVSAQGVALPESPPDESALERTVSGLSEPDLRAGLQLAQAHCAETALAPVLRGLEALLEGDVGQGRGTFVHLPAVPELPELQALCVAAWLWAHTQQDTLDQALAPGASMASPPWQTSTVLAMALETLLAWTAHTPALAFPATASAEGAQLNALPWL